ncbi:transposase [Streptomyces sp. NPDC026206]|uniref:transposase n=1 Tax=Streptomyces sp. NPDC026206 TaxID=3157089 RepID=UPI0033F2C91B
MVDAQITSPNTPADRSWRGSFEFVDAMLCADGWVKTPVDLTLLPEHRRGHGTLYGGLNRGRVDAGRLGDLLAGLPLPRFPDGRLVLAVDVSPWLRSDAPCSAERLFCHVYGRAKTASQAGAGGLALRAPRLGPKTVIIVPSSFVPVRSASESAEFGALRRSVPAVGGRQAGPPKAGQRAEKHRT